MLKISAGTFAENCVYNIIDKNKKVGARKYALIQKMLVVQNIYDLIDKEIKDRFETRNQTDEQISEYRSHGSVSINGEKFKYTHEDIITLIIMHRESEKFRSKLGSEQRDIIMNKEQPVLKSIKNAFKNHASKNQ